MSRRSIRNLVVVLFVILILVLGMRFALNEFGLLHPMPWPGPEKPPPIITTRGHMLMGKLTPGHDQYDYATTGNIPGMSPGREIPDDLVVVIHGFNNPPKKSVYMVGLARKTLESNGFKGVVAGYSWDADTQYDPWSTTGFYSSCENTVGNGPKLAQFVVDYKARCPGSRVHIMGYSMGARLALEAVKALDEDPGFADTSFIIDSVHLAGAAVGNNSVEVGHRYGGAIERRAGVLVNYYSFEDNILGALYPVKGLHRALGETDIQNKQKKPRNYLSMDAEKELLTFDAKGHPLMSAMGDNHMNCLGYLDADGNILDDGIMDLVAQVIGDIDNGEMTYNGRAYRKTESIEVLPVARMRILDVSWNIFLVALLWVIPYAAGMMAHHFGSGNRLRAAGWLVVIAIGLCNGIVPALVLAGYALLSSSPLRLVWIITMSGMILQLAVWWVAWHRYRRKGEITGWRTAAIAAVVAVLLIPVDMYLLAGFWCVIILMVILGLVWYKDRTRGELGGRHTVANAGFYTCILIVALMASAFTKYTVRKIRAEYENSTHLSDVGYKPYPGIEEPTDITMTRVEGFLDEGGQLDIGFRTADEAGDVMDFYDDCARKAGLTLRRGRYDPGDIPVMVAVGDEHLAMKVEQFLGDRWLVVVYWDVPDRLLTEFENSYNWEYP